ncbi:fibrinogen-binding protein [Staphylococcus aureus]|nr:fibrinogen-binding protein [Staphylococcus aureus]
MKNKLIAKSLLTLAAIGITTTTIASTADASEGYGPREKKPVSINHNIVEYNDGTFKYQSKSSPDSCVKCYTMFLPFLLIKIDVFS